MLVCHTRASRKGNRLKPAADVLKELVQPSNISAHSSTGLVGKVDEAAAEDDKAREEEELDELRRKSGLRPIPAKELDRTVQLTPWDVLHTLGQAIALSRRGAGRGLAERWGCLKYSQALTCVAESFMTPSAEGRETADYYKAIQSGELGTGFALTLARPSNAARVSGSGRAPIRNSAGAYEARLSVVLSLLVPGELHS